MSTRADKALVDRGLVSSRTRAAREIAAGRVLRNGQVLSKAAEPIAESDELTLVDPDPWVARSAHKLLGALQAFGIEQLTGQVALDAGASTGGFSQVLLHYGVRTVHAVDVGHGQLAPSLVHDERVMNHEGLNLRELRPAHLAPDTTVDIITADVSFISLTLLLPALTTVCHQDTRLLLMVKPQFELSSAALDKHGVVSRAADRLRAVESVIAAAAEANLAVCDLARSCLPGPAGNREYFLDCRLVTTQADHAGIVERARRIIEQEG